MEGSAEQVRSVQGPEEPLADSTTGNQATIPSSQQAANGGARTSLMEVVDLVSDSDDDASPDDKVKTEHVLLDEKVSRIPDSFSSDSEIEVVAVIRQDSSKQDLSQPVEIEPSRADIACVGTREIVRALVDYPHFRFSCGVEPFKRQRIQKKLKHCERCFCYVCDIPAKDCSTWNDHCRAVDTMDKWRSAREKKLENRRRTEMDTRGTVYARYRRPVPHSERICDDGSLPSGEDDMREYLSGDDEKDEWNELEALEMLNLEDDIFTVQPLKKPNDATNIIVLSSEARNKQKRRSIIIDAHVMKHKHIEPEEGEVIGD